MSYSFGDIKKLDKYIRNDILGYPDDINNNNDSYLPTVSELEVDSRSIYIETGAGADSLLITINQENGTLETKLRRPNNDSNDFYFMTEPDVLKELQAFVVKKQSGGKTRKRKQRKNRRSTRRN
jgi:hypothetical protein